LISLYRQKTSWLHRLSAGAKLLALCMASVAIFPLDTLSTLAILGLLTILLYASLSDGGLRELKVIVPLWPWFLIMWLFHYFGGDPLIGTVAVLKMALMILLANLLTLSTRQSDLLAAIQYGLSPLSFLGLSTRPLALAVSLMIRYIPVLLALIQQHQQAWQARGGRRAGRWRLIVPALIAALQIAEHAGESLAARGGVRGLS